MAPPISRLLKLSRKYCAVLAVIAVLSTLATLPGASQEKSSDDRQVRQAQQFLRALHPEVASHGYVLQATKTGLFDSEWPASSPLDIEIVGGSGDWPCENGAKSHSVSYACKERILTASFEFGVDDALNQVRINPVRSTANKSLRMDRIVEEHPEWSETQISDALSHAGAKFGPSNRDALLHALPTDQLAAFLGPVTVKSAQFRFRHEQKPKPLAELYWDVEASSVLANGSKADWTFYFEPFEGSLTNLYRDTADKQ